MEEAADNIKYWFDNAMKAQEFRFLNSHASHMCEQFRVLLRPMFDTMLKASETIDTARTNHTEHIRTVSLRVQARCCESVLSTLQKVDASQKLQMTLDAVWKRYERDGNPENLQNFRYLVTRIQRHLQLVENTRRIFMGLLEDTEKEFECNLSRIISSQLDEITSCQNVT